MERRGCTPVLEVDGFPVIKECGGTYWLFQRFLNGTPVYSPIRMDMAANIAYRYRGEYRKRGMEDKIKIHDIFIKKWMLPLEHEKARRAVMRAALRAYHSMRRELPELSLGKVLATTWRIYRWKGSVRPEEVEEELRKEMIPA